MKDDSDALKTIIDANKHPSQTEKIVQTIKSGIPPSLKDNIKKVFGK